MNTEHICAKCNEPYGLNEPDMEPSEYCDDCVHGAVDDLKAELERVQRQNAALLAEVRFWSSEHKHAGDCEFGEEGCYLCRNAEKEHYLKITKPLLANADAELLTKEQVRPLVELALNYRSEVEGEMCCLCCGRVVDESGNGHRECLVELITAHARSLGF